MFGGYSIFLLDNLNCGFCVKYEQMCKHLKICG